MSAELLNVSPWGVWILVLEREYYLPFVTFPFLENATIAELREIELLFGFHLRWPMLDVDVHIESLTHPEAYPLVDRKRRPPRRRPGAPPAAGLR